MSRNAERDQFLHDLFVTALEGGIGYWSQCEEYHWSTGDSHTADLQGFKAAVIDVVEHEEIEGDTPTLTINRAVIAKGLRLLAAGKATYGGAPLSARKQAYYAGLQLTNGEGHDWDASDADEIVQAGLFGDVRYG